MKNKNEDTTNLVRLSLSLDSELFMKLEKLVEQKKYRNRSEFIRDIVRDKIVAEQWGKKQEVVATLTLIFNHHKRELSEKLTDIQHHHHSLVLAATHVHLSEEICAEMIMLKGRSDAVKELVDLLAQQKGVLHHGVTMSSTGKELV